MTGDPNLSADLTALQERIAALESELHSSRQQVEVAHAMTEIAAELAATLDPAQVTPRVALSGCRLLHGRLCTLYRLDPASGSLTCIAAAGDADPQRWIGHSLPAGMGMAARTIATRAPIVVPDMLADPDVVLPDWLRERALAENLRAVTAVPLVSRGEPVGALVIVDEAGRVAGAETLPLLMAFAAQAAIALDNARLYSAMQQELVERLRTEETLARYRFLADQARDIVLCVRRDGRIIEANRAAVTAYGYSPQELLSLTVHDLRAPETRPLTLGQMAQADAEGILFETLHRRRDGSTFPVEVSSRGTALGGERILVSIIRDISARRHGQAALAAQLDRLEAVRAVTAEITRELDLPSLLQLLIRRAVELTGAASGTVSLWDETLQRLVPQVWQGFGGAWIADLRLRLGEGVEGTVALHRKGLIVNDYRSSVFTHPAFLARSTTTAVLAEPLLYGDRLLGVITLGNEETGRLFTADDLETLALFASQAAIAIENARLHGAAVRRQEELRALLRATSSAMSGPDLRTILDRIVEEAAAITACSHVKLLLVDQETRTLHVGAIKGTPLLPDFRMPIGRGLSGRVAATAEPLFVEDPGADPENLFAEVDRARGVATYLGLPVKTRDQVLGVLTFNTTIPHRYTGDELAYLGSFAAQAAIALEKAELLREEQSRRQQLEAVEAISAEMTRELDLPRVLDIIARRARELVGASACAVWLWSEAEAALSVQAWSGMGEEGHGVRIRLGEGVTGEAARRREGLIVNDYGSCPFAHPHFLAWAPHRAVLAEPVLYRDRLLGVIAMDHLDGERIFRTRDHHVLRLLAAHAAIAIENARLFAEVNRSYRELQRAQDELIRSEKLRALGQLAAGVAHDLNNILAAVLGQAQLLQLRIPDPEIQDALATLENAATDGAHIVRRLQDFARQRARSELVPMDLGAAVQEALEIARPRWRDEPQRHGHVIAITTMLTGLPAILGHPAEVREAVTNLILNAVDAMPRGGTLALSARRVPRETERAKGPDPAAEAPATGIPSVGAECVELTIADTGTGMSEEVRQRIFEPFFTTKGARGSGLGLSVVYGIMERLGGRIALDSTQGQGTRVSLRFQAAGSPPVAPGKESPAASTPLRVLLVDDDAMVRETVGSLLRIMGHQTIEADGGAAGIARLAGSPVDVVMTDLGMPEVTGWEVARAAKAHDPSLPVILLTGWGDQILPESRFRDLVDRILGKPFRLEELKRAIAELHRTRSPIGPPE